MASGGSISGSSAMNNFTSLNGTSYNESSASVPCLCPTDSTRLPLTSLSTANFSNSSTVSGPVEQPILYHIGLGLALGNCLFVGTSYVVQKRALNRYLRRTGRTARNAGLGYLREWLWWVGLLAMAVGEIANFLAFGFAPASLVTPLEGLTVVVSVVLARVFLRENLNVYGQIGIFLCLIGSVIIVLMAPEEKEISTMSDFEQVFTSPSVIALGCVILTVMIVCGAWLGPRWGHRNPFIYLTIASAAGPVTVFGCKAIGLAISDTLNGVSQLSSWLTWVMVVLTFVCILIQLYYVNRTLAAFSTCVVTPVYFVTFTSFVLIASGIAFGEFTSVAPERAIVMVCGFLVIAVGVVLINIFKAEDCSWTKVGRLFRTANEAQAASTHMHTSSRATGDCDHIILSSVANLEMADSATASESRQNTSSSSARSRKRRKKRMTAGPFRMLAAAASSNKNQRQFTNEEDEGNSDESAQSNEASVHQENTGNLSLTAIESQKPSSLSASLSAAAGELASRFTNADWKRERRGKTSSQESVVDRNADVEAETDEQLRSSARSSGQNGLFSARKSRAHKKNPSDASNQQIHIRTSSSSTCEPQANEIANGASETGLNESDGYLPRAMAIESANAYKSVPSMLNVSINGRSRGSPRSTIAGGDSKSNLNPHDNLVCIDLDINSSSQPC